MSTLLIRRRHTQLISEQRTRNKENYDSNWTKRNTVHIHVLFFVPNKLLSKQMKKSRKMETENKYPNNSRKSFIKCTFPLTIQIAVIDKCGIFAEISARTYHSGCVIVQK